nr:MAG TPA: hypothetical protein [Caudoviricetes sp.]
MKFRITATSCTNDVNMLEYYPFLKDRIKIEQTTESETTCFGSVTYTYEKCFIEIATLDELIELSNMCGTEIIIDANGLEIYDGYRE